MLRTFHISSKNEYRPNQKVTVYNTMPDRKAKEVYRIVKLVHYNKADEIGEFQVKPINVSKDPGNLTDKNGNPSPGLR